MLKPGFKFSFSDTKPQAFKIIPCLHLCCFIWFCGFFSLILMNKLFKEKLSSSHNIFNSDWHLSASQHKTSQGFLETLLLDKTRCFLINHPHFSSGFYPVFSHHGPSSFQFQLHSQFYNQINTIKYLHSDYFKYVLWSFSNYIITNLKAEAKII